MIGPRCGTLLCLGALCLSAQDVRDYDKKITEFTLPNGLHFILLERHQVPVVSFHTLVNVGSAEDPVGRTGLAHMVERLAFKGTDTIGTRNWAAEKNALEEVEEASTKLDAERNLGPRASEAKLTTLTVDLKTKLDAARGFADPDELSRALQENGAVGVSSQVNQDFSETSYSLPSNRIELWFLLESQRLAHPVFRDFYRARDAMQVEILNNVDSKPLPKLQQSLLATAFAANPYRNPVLGWPGDSANLRPSDARSFVDTYYVPANTVIAIAGDVDPVNARRLADRYFGPLPAKPLPSRVHTAEPPQDGPKSVTVWSDGQQLLMVGYRRPPETNRDDPAFDVFRTLLGEGRTGLLYRELVENKKIAQSVDVTATFPAGRSANLFVFTVAPAANHSVEENEQALNALLGRFAVQPLDAASIDRAKNELRAKVVRLLGTDSVLASLLARYYVTFGDWRKLFAVPADYEHVTAEDVQRVTAQYFVAQNRTVAYMTSRQQVSTSGGAR